MIQKDQLIALVPSMNPIDAGVWATHFSMGMLEHDIDTPNRVQMFFANVLHESQGLRKLSENLNYSAEAILKTWPARFKTLADAQPYARNPEKLANKVYGGRKDLGNDMPGDGWKHRGFGPIQATGKKMHQAAGEHCFGDPNLFVNNPQLLMKHEYGAIVSCWIWKDKGCNELADAGNFEGTVKKINGGLIGLHDRLLWLARCEKVLKAFLVVFLMTAVSFPAISIAGFFVLLTKQFENSC
jgi:putative chitinase